ncbi:GNAT family N-acetyltransferase [Candidatus Dependentiae bacterium]|nr:GNAT family N-acetyltransferase [Candidatus Dependentiae bacterium]
MSKFSRSRLLAFALAISVLVGGGIVAVHHFTTKTKIEVLDFDETRDKSFILDIFKNDWYWLVSEYSTDFSPEYMLHYRASSKSAENIGDLTIKVIYENGKPVGFTAYHKLSLYVGRIIFVAVDKNFRSKGYGYKLLQLAVDDLKSRGAQKIRLVTRTNNAPGIKLYTRFGFKETSRDEDGFLYFQYDV